LVETCSLFADRHTSSTPPGEVPADVRQVRDRLADELLTPPTLADMALMAGVSRYQVLRRFERVYGLPPHAWLLQQRAERARRLIRDGCSLSLAAVSAGFADQSHMTRVFVRYFGFTPGAWRRAAARTASA
jgi:AraC-like DNA-binding protein